jgi:16S rRNA C967 or C1407 C5-methylase (RsmB/RsmF family)/NOL1/NOP2/fmu family ribosome biogenesis protein
MLPDQFIQRIKSQDYIDSEALMNAFEEKPPVSIRLNSSKWIKSPKYSERVDWCINGYYLDKRPSYTLDPLFHAGCYYPQEASSMFLEQAIIQSKESLENICVLDLCAAPGGKSIHLSDLIGQKSLLVANEVIRSRASILAETITKWGSANTIVTQSDPSVFGRLSGFFDIILVDAPCSGEGMFRNSEAVKEWSVENAAHCSERQKRILMDVWPALKENGILIYSTCTFNPAENEENVNWLLSKHEAETVSMNIERFKGVEEIIYNGIYGYGFYPGKIKGEGFFISVIRKKVKQERKLFRNQKRSVLLPEKIEYEIAKKWTNFSHERLLRWNNDIFALHGNIDDYIQIVNNMNVIKAGTKIFTVKNNNYVPSHDLALSSQFIKNTFPHEEINLTNATRYLSRNNFMLNCSSKGWNIVSYKGVCIGFVNDIGRRVNNYFPVDWRIKMKITEIGLENIIKWDDDDFDLT